DPDVAARVRDLLALRPDAVRAGDPDRDDGGTGPQREHGDPVAGFLERTVGAARALGEDEQDLAVVEDAGGETEGFNVGGAAVDRVDTPVRRRPPDDRPG